MTHMVQCIKLGKQAEGLERAPYPGELGKRIYENISQQVLVKREHHRAGGHLLVKKLCQGEARRPARID